MMTILEDLEQILDCYCDNSRLEFEEVFILFTKILSYRSSCAKTKQAALLVNNNRVISIGVNGPPSGEINCIADGGEEVCGKDLSGSCLEGIHAEQNCLGYASRYGIRTDNCKLYVTMTPCINCAKLIIAAGIEEYIYIDDYRITEGIDFLNNHGIKTRKI